MVNKSDNEKKLNIVSISGTVVAFIAGIDQLLKWLKPFYFPCKYNLIIQSTLKIFVILMCIFCVVEVYSLLVKKIPNWFSVITIGIFVVFLAIIFWLNFLIDPNIKIIEPNAVASYPGYISYRIEACNLRKDMNLKAEVMDEKKTRKDYILDEKIPWSSPKGDITGKLKDKDFITSGLSRGY